MRRVITLLPFALLIMIAVNDPVWANKFTKIGSGIVGSHNEKLEFLKSLSGVFGGFLIALGLLAFATRSRFEGLIGMVTGKTFEAVTVVPVILIVLGSLMVLFSYL